MARRAGRHQFGEIYVVNLSLRIFRRHVTTVNSENYHLQQLRRRVLREQLFWSFEGVKKCQKSSTCRDERLRRLFSGLQCRAASL